MTHGTRLAPSAFPCPVSQRRSSRCMTTLPSLHASEDASGVPHQAARRGAVRNRSESSYPLVVNYIVSSSTHHIHTAATPVSWPSPRRAVKMNGASTRFQARVNLHLRTGWMIVFTSQNRLDVTRIKRALGSPRGLGHGITAQSVTGSAADRSLFRHIHVDRDGKVQV